MPSVCIVGVQWGDEGKGKIVDVLSEDAHFVVRYQGGANAGHTVEVNGQRFVMHHIPSGILHPRVKCVISNGVVIDPIELLSEIESLRKRGVQVKDNLLVSDRAHVVMPYHKTMDKIREANPKSKIGTTLRGIGPCYADKVARSGFRIADLYNSKIFKARLESVLIERNKMFPADDRLESAKVIREFNGHAKKLQPFVVDTIELLNTAVRKNKKIIFEGAHGSLLDIDFGTYPYVTSSNSDVCGLPSGTGLPPKAVNKVIGIAKAYTTRVGDGPFPTEMWNSLGDTIRERGREFGSTTGRPRRCGWFDAVSVKYACTINGVDELALTKLDILSGLAEINIAISYRINGKIFNKIPADTTLLDNCKPTFKSFRGWKQDISSVKKFGDLPANTRKFVSYIEHYLDTPVTMISIGKERGQILWKK